MIQHFLTRSFFGNTISDYLTSLGIILLAFLIIKILKSVFGKSIRKRTQSTVFRIYEFVLVNVEKFILPLLYLGSLYLGLTLLNMPPYLKKDLDVAAIIVSTFYAVRFIILIINYSIKYFWQARNETENTSLKGVSTFVSILIWASGVVFLMDNLGLRISAVIAGLGIGGIAVALAAQAVLGDFFSYFVIFFDRPFQIGDFISVDDKMGVVERIGIKTTRISSLSGEEIIFPNSNLTNSRIHNYKKMENRRVMFKIGFVYQTSLDNLKAVPGIIKGIVESAGNTKFDRAHFQSYGESSLIFEVVYYVTTPDYNTYMDIQQHINLKMYEEFSQRGIIPAYPTRTLLFKPGQQPEGANA